MKILIAIPSKKRADILRKNALAWVPLTGIDYMVFLEKEDFDSYGGIDHGMNVFILPESQRGLGFSKTIIKQYAEAKGYDVVIKIDDDICGWTDFRKRLLGQDAANQFKKIVSETVHLFETNPDVVVVSFPYSFQMFEAKGIKKNKRVQTAYIARTAFFHADHRISAFEDFAVGLNAIVKGKLVMWYGMSGIVMGVQVGKGEGGHQSYDRERQAQSEIAVLQEMYPLLKFREVNKLWHSEPDLRSVKKIGYYK